MRIVAVNPLFEYRGYERLQYPAGAPEAQMRDAAPRRAAAMVGSTGRNLVGSSSAPSSTGSVSVNSVAPGPHASQSTASGPPRQMRAVTAPLPS